MSDTAQLATVSGSANESDHAALNARNRLVIGILMVSAFVVILNETIIGVALPQFIRVFKIDASSAQWLSAAFMLTMAVVIPITGFLLQRFNTRPVFIAAMSFFSAGTLLAVLAPGFDVLLVARVVQACGTAIMFPLLMTTVMELVPPQTRGRTMGNISIVISVAPAIGPSISGLILSTLHAWQWLFALVLPIALAALIVGAIRVQNVTTPKHTKFDVLSVILSAFGFGGLVYGVSNLGTATPETIALNGWMPLAVGAVGIVLFVLRQLSLQKRDGALLDLRTFTAPTFTFSIVMLVVSMIAFFGTIIVLPIYLETVLGLKPLNTGLLLLPGGLLMGFLAPFVGRFYDKHGPTGLLVTGAILTSLTLWAMTFMGPHTSVWWVFVAYLALTTSLALLFTPIFTASLGSLPETLYSHGSAIVGTVQQVGGAAGTALLVTILSAHQISTAVAHSSATAPATIASTAVGVHWAFLTAAIISLLAIPPAFFIRASVVSGEPATTAH
ncbi:MAG TPA: DHA2 family efflux MFS transporter permease subunit [Galbitalea sp.]|jgi:DHA2 family lincomycin resistance protein-like MFS transporter|nr:DHA2 family efflux MFS transporter permease subunit [Galbitalea sp.]